MKLLSLTVRNYRLHRETTVAFAPDFTLIGGPNETGKSTLVEALHRVLFLKAAGSSQLRQAMQSTLHVGHPEVVLHFEVGGIRHELQKKFSGANGTATLSRDGLPPLSGAAAESELARLLGVGTEVSRGDIPLQWAHLWVWQGKSGEDPTTHANAQQTALQQRLQAIGGDTLLTSPTDVRLAAHFAGEVEAHFKTGDQPKAGTPLALANDEVAAATTARNGAQLRLDRLHFAVREVETTTAELTASESAVRSLKAETEALAGKLSQLKNLQAQEAGQERTQQTAQKSHADLDLTHRDILALHQRHQSQAKLVEPLAAEEKLLRARVTAAQTTVSDLDVVHRRAREALSKITSQRDLYSARRDRDQAAERLAERARSESTRNDLLKKQEQLGMELARLPVVDAGLMKKLTRAQSDWEKAEAALAAMATGIDVLAASGPIQVAGEGALAVGSSRVFTQNTEVTLDGGQTRLRIRPGGGTSLAEARAHADKFKQQLTAALAAVGVADVAKATEAFHQRALTQSQIDQNGVQLAEPHIASLPEQLATLRAELEKARADAERRGQDHLELPDSKNPEFTRIAITLATEALTLAKSAEDEARVDLDMARKKTAEVTQQLEDHAIKFRSAERACADLVAQLHLLRETHGNDADRSARLADALVKYKQANAELLATREAISLLQPEQLSRDEVRLNRAIDKNREQGLSISQRRSMAQGVLRSDGSEDPAGELAIAEERLRQAQERQIALDHQGRALRLLNQLFQTAQQELAERFTQPLAERIAGYLSCVFGNTAKVVITHTPDGFDELSLVRGFATTPFEALSGGTREQVAAATRLALAEILAADHHGCLPVVFDDAFAYADALRVRSLQSMLDLAAARGLQVIVLSCTPSDYAGLGATTHTLAIPVRSSSTTATLPDERSSSSSAVLDVSLSTAEGFTDSGRGGPQDQGQLTSQFLAILQREKAAGNPFISSTALRKELGCEVEAFNAARDALGEQLTTQGRSLGLR